MTSTTLNDPFVQLMADWPVELGRYQTLKETLRPFAQYFRDKQVLDFGCSYGLSAGAMVELGAARVIGVDPQEWRIAQGHILLAGSNYGDRIQLHYTEDTRDLPFPDASFDVVMVNAVFEHIPQPRDAYIAEVWRQVRPGGVMIVNETPNKYLPWDYHTTKLPLINWLPSELAHAIAVKLGRFRPSADWDSSGWRGMGYYEFVNALTPPFTIHHEQTRSRHTVLQALGLPSGLLDPYPLYIVEKR